jgi:hypothetical protein
MKNSTRREKGVAELGESHPWMGPKILHSHDKPNLGVFSNFLKKTINQKFS